MRKIKIALILDNPLRDLDGLVLLASRLARLNAEVFLVPMHLQVHDVVGLRPDVVLVNYLRPNNKNVLAFYKMLGIGVAVCDTEGAIAKSWDRIGKLVGSLTPEHIVDHYFCWGEVQRDSVLRNSNLKPSQVSISGCPRYDFIHTSVKDSLPSVEFESGYVLINTNFPIVSPKYSQGTSSEVKNWEKVGKGAEAGYQAAKAAAETKQDIKLVLKRLANEYPDVNFVLRPHPFEKVDTYLDLMECNNIYVRQYGTSLQWLNGAVALLHLNCTTSVESIMMGVESISLEWLNKPELKVQDASEVSLAASSYEELKAWLYQLLSSNPLRGKDEYDGALKKLIPSVYKPISGEATSVIAEKLISLSEGTSKSIIKPSFKQFSVQVLRSIIGYKFESAFRKIFGVGYDIALMKDDKIPSVDTVKSIADRISVSDSSGRLVMVKMANSMDYRNSKCKTGKVIKISGDQAFS